jgi:hypothetical protein
LPPMVTGLEKLIVVLRLAPARHTSP